MATGAIDYNKLQGYDYLTAKSGGIRDAFDAYITLSLSRDGKYKQTYAVFGTSEVRGTYTIKGDTIFLERTTPYSDDEDFQFAVIEDYPLGNDQKDTIKNYLFLHRNYYSNHIHMMYPQGELLRDMGKQ